MSAAEEMRRRFDASFAEPRRVASAAPVELLALRAGGQALAIRAVELAGIAAGARIVALPGSAPALLGVAAWRGRPVAVFGLAALLGLPEAGEPRWIAVCRDEPAAVAFEAVEGYLRAAPEALRGRGGEAAPDFAAEVLSAPDGARSVLNLARLLAASRPPGAPGPGG